MNNWIAAGTAFLMLLGAGVPAAFAARTADQEKIIDVGKLTEAMEKATAPIGQRMQKTDLTARFEAVNRLLEEDGADKKQLVQALKDLQTEIDSFTDDWDSVVSPLWEGQEAISDTVSRVRGLLARGRGAQPSSKTKAVLDNYDRRLSSLATAIKEEQDPTRQQRLKTVFANVLALRKLVEHGSSINLGPASEAVYAKMIRALTGLEAQLTQATFQVEKARVVLVCQSEFIQEYVAIMEGLIEAEELATMLSDMQGAGTGVGGLAMDVSDLTKQVEQFSAMMDGFADKLAESIEASTDKMAEEMDTFDPGVDVDEEIEKYATVKVTVK